MFQSIIDILKNFSLLVGYVKSNNFQEKLSDEQTQQFLEMLEKEEEEN